MMFWCLKMPWHKLGLKENALEPYRGKLVNCSCGKQYVIHEETKSFLPYTDSFAEYFASKSDALSHLEERE